MLSADIFHVCGGVGTHINIWILYATMKSYTTNLESNVLCGTVEGRLSLQKHVHSLIEFSHHITMVDKFITALASVFVQR